MKILKIIAALFMVASAAHAQMTSVTATVTDPDSFTWNNGTVQFALQNPHGGTVAYQGIPLTSSQMQFAGTLGSGGVFSVSLNDNTLLTPTGTKWRITLCPDASAPCQTMSDLTISGSSVNLSSTIDGQLKALRFPAGYAARAYGDVEISPIPPKGGTYWNLNTNLIRVWNGTSWQNSGGSGGGSAHGPTNSVQIANNDGTFNSDPAFTIDPTTHTRMSTSQDVVNAVSSVPRAVYDPVDTKYLGGLAAAIAGTSGHTPTQVLNAVADAAYCATKTTAAQSGWIITPPWKFSVDGVKLWPMQRFGAESVAGETFLGHSPVTAPMVALHGPSDTITCNGTVYTPGTANLDEISYIAISGAFTGAQDIGIDAFGFQAWVHDIQGWGTAFGQQAIIVGGTSSYGSRLGFPGAQISGCQDTIRGITAGPCYAVDYQNLDGWADNVYASNGAENLTGKGPGSCYPSCAAIGLEGSGMTANNLFPQLSDVGIALNVASIKGTNWRIDASSMEGVQINNNASGYHVTNVINHAPCQSSTLLAAYTAHTATGCYGIHNTSGNGEFGIMMSIESMPQGFFGASYMQAGIGDLANSGAGAGNTWGPFAYQGNPNNTTPNDWAICCSNASAVTPKYIFPNASIPIVGNGTTVNINGISAVWLTSTSPITTFIGGVAGQRVLLSASPGTASVALTPGVNFVSCDGQTVNVTNIKPVEGVWNPFTNSLELVCNPPNITPAHINWGGNPVPTDKYVLDVYGNTITRKIPDIVLDVSQLHGPNAGSGNQCFEEEAIYPDNKHSVSALACTTINLATQTPGEIFGTPSTLAVTYNLYLVSNTTGNGVPLGKYPTGGATQLFWDGPTTIAAGGDGTTPPPATENNTGMGFYPWGPVLSTYGNTQPPCIAARRGNLWLADGGGTVPDILQVCELTTGSTYAWITH